MTPSIWGLVHRTGSLEDLAMAFTFSHTQPLLALSLWQPVAFWVSLTDFQGRRDGLTGGEVARCQTEALNDLW